MRKNARKGCPGSKKTPVPAAIQEEVSMRVHTGGKGAKGSEGDGGVGEGVGGTKGRLV